MPKDTKSSGNNKAPACESRGFGHKKEGENFDTPSCRKPEDGGVSEHFCLLSALFLLVFN